MNLDLAFTKISADYTFADPSLRECFDGHGFCQPHRLACKVEKDGMEVALATYDLLPEFFLYLVVVSPRFRRQGLGSKILDHSKNLAREHGATRLKVRPSSRSVPPQDVKSFYRANGFGESPDDPDVMEYRLHE